MNFSQLYARLKTCLAENDSPQYWSETELKNYLNEANLAFAQQTEILTNHTYLDVSEDDNNSWFMPENVISIKGVQFKGKPIGLKRKEYLETAYAGTAHQQVTLGYGKQYRSDWRLIVGEPTAWFKENNFIKMFPRPVGNFRKDTPRRTAGSILRENTSIATLAIKIPLKDKALIDVYVNGIHESVNNWEIIDSLSDPDFSAIQFNWTAYNDMDIEVVYQESPVIAAKKTAMAYEGNNEYIFTDFWYESLSDSLRVVLNGITLRSHEYNAEVIGVGEVKITILTDIYDGIIEVTMFRRQPVDLTSKRLADRNVTVDYVYSPALLVDDEDEPEYPAIYHSAVWQYAAWLALSKEGEQTQDLQKARRYLALFEDTVNKVLMDNMAPIDIDFSLTAPFIL